MTSFPKTTVHQCLNFSLEQIGTNIPNPTDKDNIIGNSENPTGKYVSQWSSKTEQRSSTGEHICQLDLQR